MPKLSHELTPEREDELARRSAAARERLPSPNSNETTHKTEAGARKRAMRIGLPNTEVGAIETTHGWIGAVYLRPDQAWMEAMVVKAGCRAVRRAR